MREGILIIDHNQVNTSHMCDVLGTVGYDITVAKDGHEALQSLNPERHGVMFVAQHLPDFGGIDLIRELRPIAPQCKVVLLTESHDLLLAYEAETIGVKNWLYQPAKPLEILQSAFEALSGTSGKENQEQKA
jgi:DNA-binding NtrC family response regulator